MLIKPAIHADEPDIRACAQAAFSPYIAAIGRAPAPMHADFTAQIKQGVVYVMFDTDDVFLGFIVFYPQGDHMFIDNLAVMPAAAGQGVGKTLLRFCEDEARNAGLPLLKLYTNEKMTANLKIYPYLGFTETDRRHDAGFDRVYFEKRL